MKPIRGMTEAETLRSRGFDGLYHPTVPCGCSAEDLRPCGEVGTGCRGGYSHDETLGIYAPIYRKKTTAPHQEEKAP